MTSRISFCMLVVILVFIGTARAETYSGVAQTEGFILTVDGTYGRERIDSGVGVGIDADVTIDWSASTLNFDSFSFLCPGFTKQFSQSWTVGPGQEETITTTVTFDPITFPTLTDVGPVSISPGTGGNYNVDGAALADGSDGAIGDTPLTGSYVITGPTETKEGTFTTTLYSSPDYAGSFPFPSYETLDTTNYPNFMALKGDDNQSWSLNDTLIDETVDGRDITLTASRASCIISSSGLKLTLVPEPSSACLFAMGLLGMLACGLRRKRNR